jgi:hypothetical protein
MIVPLISSNSFNSYVIPWHKPHSFAFGLNKVLMAGMVSLSIPDSRPYVIVENLIYTLVSHQDIILKSQSFILVK